MAAEFSVAKAIDRWLRGVNLAAVRTIVNNQMEKPLTYNTYRYYVQNEPGLASLVRASGREGVVEE